MWSRLDRARSYGWLLAAGYGLTFLYACSWPTALSRANFLALNQGDNWLHLASAVAGLAIALWAAREARRTQPRVARS
jgi:hypothetical protein